MESKFEDVYATIETNKELIEELKADLQRVENEMTSKLVG